MTGKSLRCLNLSSRCSSNALVVFVSATLLHCEQYNVDWCANSIVTLRRLGSHIQRCSKKSDDVNQTR